MSQAVQGTSGTLHGEAAGSCASNTIAKVLCLIDRYASVQRPVVFTGPTGVGKGYYARLLHERAGPGMPFVEVTGGQLTDALFHSQLFGHVRGAFTGATEQSRGCFALAAGGTLFLDEMQYWTPAIQSALLHVLGERRFRPLGSSVEFPLACRLIFAANLPLDDLVEDERLLPDLRYRIGQFDIAVPALKERREDILVLADTALESAREEFKAGVGLELGVDTIVLLLTHEWPGNFRELRGAIEFALVTALAAPASSISVDHFPESLQRRLPPLGEGPVDIRDEAIEWMLRKTDGNQCEAARRLCLHRNTISRRNTASKDTDSRPSCVDPKAPDSGYESASLDAKMGSMARGLRVSDSLGAA